VEFYDKIFARPERGVEAYSSAAGACGGGTRDLLARPAGAEARLQDRWARSAIAQRQRRAGVSA